MKKTFFFLKIFFVISVISISQTFAQTYVKLDGTEFDNITPISPYDDGRELNYIPDGSAAFDGSLESMVNAFESTGRYLGLELNDLTKITKIRFYPRHEFTDRMLSGVFQASNDGINYTDFYTISTKPADNVWTEVTVNADCRFVRYLSGLNTYCSVVEIEFYRTEGQDPVVVPVQTVSMNTSYTIKTGDKITVTHTILPANATDKRVSYSIIPGIANIDPATGILTGLTQGTATITVTTNDGGKTATSNLTVAAATDVLLTGTIFGNTGNLENVFDGNTDNYIDGLGIVWVGLDLGSSKKISMIKYYPRTGWSSRMIGGKFQGSSDGTTYTTMNLITTKPQEGKWTTVQINPFTNSYQYVRYLGPEDGYGNISELEFWSPVETTTGLTNHQALENVILYPNPVDDILSLSVNADKIIITGIDGKEVLISKGSDIDVSSLTKGIYFVNYFVGESTGVSKIIKR